jgi:hypothetical protein
MPDHAVSYQFRHQHGGAHIFGNTGCGLIQAKACPRKTMNARGEA